LGHTKAVAQTNWNFDGGSVWQINNKWSPTNAFPNADGAAAVLGSVITGDHMIRLGDNVLIGSLVISNGNAYKIAGAYNPQFSIIGAGSASLTVLGGGAPSITSKIDLYNDLVITQSSSGTLTLRGDINVTSQSITKYGTGVLELTGNGYFGNGLIINQGTVRTYLETSLGNGTNVTLNGGVLNIAANLTTDGTGITTDGSHPRNYTIGANGGTFNVTNGATFTISSGTLLSGSSGGTLTKDGTGTLVLAGDNSARFTGNINIVGGTVQVSAENNLGALANHVTLNGGTLDVTSGFTSSASKLFTMGASGGTFNVEDNQTLTLGSGQLAGSGNLTMAGTGTLVLVGNNTAFTGTNILNAGTVKITAENNLGAVTDSVIFNGGTLEVAGTFTNNASKVLYVQSGGGTLTIDSGFTNTLAGSSQVNGSSTLTKDGSGTLSISGNQNTNWTGSLVINNGTVRFSGLNGSATGVTGVTVASGGTLLLDSSVAINSNRVSNVTTTGGTLHFTGNSANMQEHVGTLTLAGGDSTIEINRNAGGREYLVIDSLSRTDPYATVSFNNTGNGTLGNTGNNNPEILINSPLTLTNGIIGGWATAVSASGNTLEFATVANGTNIQILGSYANGNETTWKDGITNAKPGATVTMTANRSVYTLALTNGGRVNLGGFTLTNVGGGLLGQGNSSISGGTITVGTPGTGGSLFVHVDSGGFLTNNAVVANNGSGVVSLVKANSGTLLLGGANTYTGGTYVHEGTLMLSAANSVPSSSALTVANGATFDLNGLSESLGSIAGAGSITSSTGTGALTTGRDNTSTEYSGVMSGNMTLAKTGSGTLTLSGASTFTGNTTISGGTVSISQESNLGNAANAIALNGGTLNVSESFTASSTKNLIMTGAGTLDINSGQTLAFSTVNNDLTGSGALTKSGSGTVIFGGASNYTGNLVINAGEVKVQGTAANVDFFMTNNNRTANLSGAGGTLTYALTQSVTNMVTMQPSSPSNIKLGFDAAGGANPYYVVGPTNVNNLNWAGLEIKGGTVNLGVNHTLVGNGATTLDVSGGTFVLGGGYPSGAKTLTVSGDVNLTGGYIDGGPGGGSRGAIVTSGNIVSSGTVLLNGPDITMQPGNGVTTTVGGTTPLNGVHTFTKDGSGTVRLDQSMTVSAGVQINSGTLLMGANDRLNNDASIIMAGGTFATGGHSGTVGTLTLQASATLDLGGAGHNSVLAFADSSIQTWTGTLTITNYLQTADTIYIGTTSTGLTSNQLSQIVWDNPYGNSLNYSGAVIEYDGRVHPQPVPEAKTVVAIFLLAGVIVWRERKLIGLLVKKMREATVPRFAPQASLEHRQFRPPQA
jgi:autotransporter-associated beta strand protein